ncbi:4-alpha-glucanotransferase [uncultured Gilvimarinus sp.]|uniref:4-alpha-glucanotransferase n=1 Tax=uncultured Gilvimarinus sp. TaxID=1689143 RepID=UPI0030DCCB55
MQDKQAHKHLSTTALARAIGKDSKELFILLANSGWIVKVDGQWHLTEKGRFEGGTYANHPKYGEYIVWPESLRQHSVLRLLPDAPLSARNLSQKLNLPARLVNLLLAERGWIKRHVHGWHLTERGEALGGQQHVSDSTAIPFVTWPESLLENPQLKLAAQQLSSSATTCTDGHPSGSAGRALIDNWLYVAGLTHAVDYTLVLPGSAGGTERLTVDFYLPQHQIAIVYWGKPAGPGELAEHLDAREKLKTAHFSIIEIEYDQLNNLDEMLARELMQHSIAVY